MWLKRTSQPKAPSLVATWNRTFANVIAIVFALGILAMGVNYLQGAQLVKTTSRLQHANEALVKVDRAVLETAPVSIGVLYRDSEAGPEQARAAFGHSTSRMNQALDEAERVLGSAEARLSFAAVREMWEGVEETVLGAEERYSDEEIDAIVMFSPSDPFLQPVWLAYDDMSALLTEVRQSVVEDARDDVDTLGEMRRFGAVMMLAIMALGLLLAVRAARRMTRMVVKPLASVGKGAAAMHDLKTDEPVLVTDAVGEVQDLADIVNEAKTSLRAQHARLEEQAHTDGMTSLPNREAFTLRLSEMLGDPDQGRVAVLFVDLDDFKQVNDTLGHSAGDELLRIVAQRLRAAAREGELVARLGGDEFALALALREGTTDAAPTAAAERVRAIIAEPIEVAGHRLKVTCSVGVAIGDGRGETVDELLSNSDFAMYMAKGRGKNGYEVHSFGVHNEMLTRLRLARDLSEALEREEFALHFQPVVDIDSARTLGFEALIRWQHPEHGLVPPDEFIGLAEQSGAINEIGAWVIDTACASLVSMLPLDPALMMGVNVSPLQLLDPGFADLVLGCLELHGLRPDQLIIEITEATAMSSSETHNTALQRLRGAGVQLALDDFGAGFSSLRYLDELPLDILKIDRSFVSGRGSEHTETLEAIVRLGEGLGLAVVAEGIETEEDLARLKLLGVRRGQGYLFARPMTLADSHRHLTHQRASYVGADR